jgi:chemotaxis protein MotA
MLGDEVDLASLIGLGLAIATLVGACACMGVTPGMFVDPGAFVMILGGTTAATMLAFPLPVMMKAFVSGFKICFMPPKYDEQGMIAILVSFAEKARREGLLALEAEAGAIEDDFLRKGIQLVIDGRDTEVIRKILETEVNFHHEQAQKGEQLFTTMGGFAPTMGIIGTVLGLMSMLARLGAFMKSDDVAGQLGEAVASAFIATFLGVFSANLIWLPIANKLKQRAGEEAMYFEIVVEGILAVQAGDNPRLLEEKLHAYLDPHKVKEEVKDGGVAATEAAAPAGA